MPKRKRYRSKRNNDQKELILKDPGQEYAQVIKLLGNGRLTATCFDGKERLCHIRGKMRKRTWINNGDVILISLRDFQDDKADVIHKYTSSQAKILKSKGLIPDEIRLQENEKLDYNSEDNKAGDDIEFIVDDI